MTLAAIAFGVAALILSGGFIEDALLQLREATVQSRLGHIEVFREGYSVHGRREPFAYMIEDPAKVAAAIASDPRVSRVAARLTFQGLLNNGRSDLPVVVEGVDARTGSAFGGYVSLIAGTPIAPGDGTGALIGEGVAQSMRRSPGDFFTLVASVPGGAMNTLEMRVTGVFRTFSSDFDNRAIRIPIAAAHELLTVNGAHSVIVFLKDTDDTDAMSGTLKKLLPQRGYEVRTWLELDDFYPKTMELYKRQFGILQLIILGIVMLSVANSVNMTAFERMGEYGTLRALGTGTGGIVRLILLENLVLGVVGAALGMAAGIALGAGLSAAGIPMPPPPNANSGYVARIQLAPLIIASAALIGILATVGSSVIAVVRVSRTSIAEALRYNA